MLVRPLELLQPMRTNISHPEPRPSRSLLLKYTDVCDQNLTIQILPMQVRPLELLQQMRTNTSRPFKLYAPAKGKEDEAYTLQMWLRHRLSHAASVSPSPHWFAISSESPWSSRAVSAKQGKANASKVRCTRDHSQAFTGCIGRPLALP